MSVIFPTIMSSASNSNRVALAPLREWKERESERQISAWQTSGRCEAANKQALLRKTAVAYGIAEVLRHTRSHRYSASSHVSLDGQCNIDNFVVRTNADGQSSRPSWRDVEGVDMLSPKLSVNIAEPSFLCDSFQEGNDDIQEEMGGFLEVEFPSHPDTDGAAIFICQSEEGRRCHLFGVLLNELFSHRPPISAENARRNEGGTEATLKNGDAPGEPARKKTQLADSRAVGVTGQRGVCPVWLEEGLPSSIKIVIQNLLECGEDNRPDTAYDSLDEVIEDLHIMMLDPSRFLFDNVPIYDELGNPQLSFREHKLYGRENEVVLITEGILSLSWKIITDRNIQ